LFSCLSLPENSIEIGVKIKFAVFTTRMLEPGVNVYPRQRRSLREISDAVHVFSLVCPHDVFPHPREFEFLILSSCSEDERGDQE